MVEEDPPASIPEWVVTFGDMMSLLLTFFIMLVSMSEMKKDDKFQSVADSLEQQFGHDSSNESRTPGAFQPRNSELATLTAAGRAKRKNITQGGAKVRAPEGENKRVERVRPGAQTGVGLTLRFKEGADKLSDDEQGRLASFVTQIQGKPQKIEVRGHSTQRPSERAAGRDVWDLAYSRARGVMATLVEQYGVDPVRVRLAVSGPFEPLPGAGGRDTTRPEARVEVFLLDEVSSELTADSEEIDASAAP